MFVILLVCFACLRLVFLLRNFFMADEIGFLTLAGSFLVGMRFDLVVSSYLLIPLFAVLLVLGRSAIKPVLVVFCILMGTVFFLALAEIEFYRGFEERLNASLFEYSANFWMIGGITGAMVRDGFPVVKYITIWTGLAAASAAGTFWLKRRILDGVGPGSRGAKSRLVRTGYVLAFILMTVLAMRGGELREGLKWGDAYHSGQPFANDLALNGFFTLAASTLDKYSGGDSYWVDAFPANEARRIARGMLFLPGEADISSPRFPILRSEGPVSLVRNNNERPVNVVVILMESFSGRHVGALGADVALTPEFDNLSREGVLFERFFSNGTRSHQAVFASFASFPNLPGYEYLMNTDVAEQEFSSLPAIFSSLGYDTVFLCNCLFSFNNMEGFLGRQGVGRFIGASDYVDPTFVEPIWGVSDYDVFMRANEEFKAMAGRGPFFAAIFTSSNHYPFSLPEPLPFEPIVTGDPLEDRYNAMRYADWALGEFFARASREEYFQDTLFVLAGDHGFGTRFPITDMQLQRYHVPLLFYGPGVIGAKGLRRDTVSSHVDILPSVLGLLDIDAAHHQGWGWGRNLFDTGLKDEGFAVVRASGGENSVALVKGDYVLVDRPGEEARLYSYDLGFPARYSRVGPTREPRRRGVMTRMLRGYVEAGLLALRTRTPGIQPGILNERYGLEPDTKFIEEG